jgi:hypothetical protein
MKTSRVVFSVLLCLSHVAFANDAENQTDMAMKTIVQAFRAGKIKLDHDVYMSILDVEYIKDESILRVTHGVDMNKMFGREYLDASTAEYLAGANRYRVCSSGFGVLLRNKLVNVEHVYLNTESRRLVLRYMITLEDCHAKK